MYLFVVKTSFVRFWADPPLLRLAFVAGLFAFIERGAQFELFALYRKRRAASPNLCFNHAQGGFRGHCPNAGLVRCTWILCFLFKSRRVGLRKDRPRNVFAVSYLGGREVRLQRTASACSLLHLPHSRTWADPPLERLADVAGEAANIERGAQSELLA